MDQLYKLGQSKTSTGCCYVALAKSSHKKKLTDVIIWEMHGFLHKFPTVRENATKPMVWGKPGKSITILFP